LAALFVFACENEFPKVREMIQLLRKILRLMQQVLPVDQKQTSA